VHAQLLFREQYVAMSSPDWRPPGRSGRALSLGQLARTSLVVASPTATYHGSVEQMLVRMKLADRIVLRARHFGALPDLALATDLLAIVPEMYARNLSQQSAVKLWQLPDAPFYDVRMVWHASTARDPAHQWMRTLLHRLFARPPAKGAVPDAG
jgi:DNA-binding transcriptional LysR family regulator